jgi:hypothetical protein
VDVLVLVGFIEINLAPVFRGIFFGGFVRETKFIIRVVEILIVLCVLTFVVIVGGILLGGCSDELPYVEAPTYEKPKSGAKRHYAKNGWDIRSEKDIPPGIGTVTKKHGVIVWDLDGAILDGSKQKGDGSQNEGQEPLFRARVPFALVDGFVQHNKNAATFYAPNSALLYVTFTDIGEDAVATSKGAYDFELRGNVFINDRAGDKSIQLNEARGALVAVNMVFSGRTCMRIGDSGTTSVSDEAVVNSNRFLGCDTAIHASKITVLEKTKNYFENVRLPRKDVEGARFLLGEAARAHGLRGRGNNGVIYGNDFRLRYLRRQDGAARQSGNVAGRMAWLADKHPGESKCRSWDKFLACVKCVQGNGSWNEQRKASRDLLSWLWKRGRE